MTDVLAGREQTIPALAILTDCCSIASNRACCWCPSLSNSSMQHKPREKKINRILKMRQHDKTKTEENCFFSKKSWKPTNVVDLSDLILKFLSSVISNVSTDSNAMVLCNRNTDRYHRNPFSYPGQPAPKLRPLKRNLLLLHLGINLRLVLEIKTVIQ